MIAVLQGDITKIKADAIVNAANTSLLGGGGVDGAIHRAGGRAILEECRRIGGCKTGDAVITTGGNLPAKYVIHTVGPVWNGGKRNEEALLTSAYTNSLKLAAENNLQIVAFPNISTGIYHFPKKLAAEIAISTVKNFLKTGTTIKQVIFVCYDIENYNIYNTLLNP